MQHKKSINYNILLLSFFTYLTVYMLRVNYSSSLPALSAQLGIAQNQLGIGGAIFFITYAFGQLVNGFISDAISPFRFVFAALVGTVTTNLLVGLSQSFWSVLLFWGINGYFQSIFWACLIRILSLYFGKSKHSMVSTTMSASMVGGFIMTWAVLGHLLRNASWRYYFCLPALWGALMILVWAFVLRKTKKMEIPKSPLSLDTLKKSILFIADKKLYYVCLICLCMSFVKESISVWGPTIIAELLGVTGPSSTFVLFIIPIGNLCGMFFSKFLIDRYHGNEIKTLRVLFCLMMCAAAAILFRPGFVWVTVLMIGVISAICFGANSILISYIPLAYTKYNIVSTIVGIFDFSSYLGAAASSMIIGAVLTKGSWIRIAPVWIIMVLLALTFCAVAKRKTQLL